MRYVDHEAGLNIRVSGHLKRRLEKLAAERDTSLSAFLREQLEVIAQAHERHDAAA
jgi:predicted transcriptional regulator